MPHVTITPKENVYGLYRNKKIILFKKGIRICVWKKREDKNWFAFRRLILKEQGARCKICHKDKIKNPNTILQVHHLNKVSKYPDLIYDKNNCVVLCIECHKKQHRKIMGAKMKEELEELKKEVHSIGARIEVIYQWIDKIQKKL